MISGIIFFIALMMASGECETVQQQALWSGAWLIVMLLSARQIKKEED